MSLEKTQLLEYFEANYRSILRRRTGENQAKQDEAFPGRAITAFALQRLTGILPSDAFLWDVDGGNDEGIDSFYFDSAKHTLFLIQGKGGGDGGDDQPRLTELQRFLGGVRLFLTRNFAPFSDYTPAQLSEAQRATADSELKICLCIAHFGGILSDRHTKEIARLITEYNRSFTDERMRFLNFNRDEAHAALMEIRRSSPIDCQLELLASARHDGPPRCFYGHIKAEAIKSLYDAEGARLFEQNVRYYRGRNLVNNKIKSTVETNSDKLFVLNNGITALCSSINPTSQAATTSQGPHLYDVKGLSVVNGAQTVGTIAASLPAGDTSGTVFIKIIEIPSGDEALAREITEATNFQTTVDKLDYLSLYRRHAQFAEVLEVSGIKYYFKRDTQYWLRWRTANGFILDEALETRICASGNVDRIYNYRKKPESVRELIRNEPKKLFPDSLTAQRLWREVQMGRIIDQKIDYVRFGYGHVSEQEFFKQGSYFLKMLVFKRTQSLAAVDALTLTVTEIQTLEQNAETIVNEAYAAGSHHGQYDRGFYRLFRTKSELRVLFRTVMANLNAQAALQTP